ncbi:hypothetical protein ACHAWF_011958 [Thalassiosira exigua]
MADIVLSNSAGPNGRDIDAICLGSGRFLRSVLVPFLSSNGKPAVFQTRGRTFLDSFRGGNDARGAKRDADGDDLAAAPRPSLTYPVDTVEFNGATSAADVDICAAGTLGTSDGKSRLMDGLLSEMRDATIVGVGVTEAGLKSADARCMRDLARLLFEIYRRNVGCSNPNGKICVVNTDNVPDNGDVLRRHALENAAKYDEDDEGAEGGGGNEGFVEFLESKVAFLNSMVDRITSSRPGSDGLVPRCEPLPGKALVICDPGKDLPAWMIDEVVQSEFGVKIRHDPKDLASDLALKLRVANGTHTAVAHAMALSSMVDTEALSGSAPSAEVVLGYVDSLYAEQILPGALLDGISADETEATWDDWRRRLKHPHFGLSTFFITQNGAAKVGIRLGPTIESLVGGGASSVGSNECRLSVAAAFAAACVLRFLTPASAPPSSDVSASEWSDLVDGAKTRGAYVGWLDVDAPDDLPDDAVAYADGLRYNLGKRWYEFRCDCPARWKSRAMELPKALSQFDGIRQPRAYRDLVRSYLLHPRGGNLEDSLDGDGEEDESRRARSLDAFVSAVSTLYARLVGGDGIATLLKEMSAKEHVYAEGFATSCACLDDSQSFEC